MLDESFLILHKKVSPRIAKAVDNSKHYEQKGRRAITISCPLCVMALFPLAFGWLALWGILWVPCRTTSWQSMEFLMLQHLRVYGQLLRP
jgi:hypothetical protein